MVKKKEPSSIALVKRPSCHDDGCSIRRFHLDEVCSVTISGRDRNNHYKFSFINTARNLSSGGEDGDDHGAIRFTETDSEFDGGNSIIDRTINVIVNVLSYPVPVPFLSPLDSSTLPFAYPLVLLSGFALLSLSTSVLISVFFSVYLVLGRSVAYDDSDRDNNELEWDSSNPNSMDLAALAGSIASAGLFSPSGLRIRDDEVVLGVHTSTGLVLGSFLLALAIVTVMTIGTDIRTRNVQKESFGGDDNDNENAASTDDPSRRLLELWDDKFAQLDQSSKRRFKNEKEKEGKQNQE